MSNLDSIKNLPEKKDEPRGKIKMSENWTERVEDIVRELRLASGYDPFMPHPDETTIEDLICYIMAIRAEWEMSAVNRYIQQKAENEVDNNVPY